MLVNCNLFYFYGTIRVIFYFSSQAANKLERDGQPTPDMIGSIQQPTSNMTQGGEKKDKQFKISET